MAMGVHIRDFCSSVMTDISHLVNALAVVETTSKRLHNVKNTLPEFLLMSKLLKPLISELQLEGVSRLFKYLLQFQIDFVNDKLVAFGQIINSYQGELDGWSRSDLTCRLMAVAVIPSELSPVLAEWELEHPGHRSVSINRAPKSADKASKGADRLPKVERLHKKDAKKAPVVDVATQLRRKLPCHSALLALCKIAAPACVKGSECRFAHDLSDHRKEELRKTAALLTSPAHRDSALAFIQSMK